MRHWQTRVRKLFKPGEDPCGKYIRVNGIYYRVIGMCSSEGNVNIQGQASEAVTLPFTTMQQTYNLGQRIDVVCFIMKPGVKVKDVEPEIEHRIKAAILSRRTTNRQSCSSMQKPCFP